MTGSDSELEPVLVRRKPSPFRFPRLSAITCPPHFNWLFFLVLITGQLIGIILFTIWAVDCFFREFRTTGFCNNFHLFSAPESFQFLWLLFSSANSFFLIYHTIYRSPAFAGTRKVVGHLYKKKYFYKINLVLTVVVVYDIYVMSNEPQTWKTMSYILFITEKVFTVALMLFLNFLPRFWTGGRLSTLKYWLYKAALAVYYVLQNFVMALLGSTIATYKVLTIKPNVDTQDPGPRSIVALMLLVTYNGYRYFVAEFFFSKIFDDELDILGGKTIQESIGANEQNGQESYTALLTHTTTNF
ncbi:uncharacterized protein LOC114534892 [Dendronephthya gigantea]|uniref:uncharacterized protein LOC114534892 n=1 Tax=Dendronephthya gigantea TaxID=151771 RepID=UPI00106BAA13|nr:uncharacterized protein LOC114534892 [Dendronephthya gigantea]